MKEAHTQDKWRCQGKNCLHKKQKTKMIGEIYRLNKQITAYRCKSIYS